MAKEMNLTAPDFLFETSWEVCNKVGGIYTVIATKAQSVMEQITDNYILIGPDIHRGREIPGFIEDNTLYRKLKDICHEKGIRIKVGRWDIVGTPVAVLVDFSYLYSQKDEVLKNLWLDYKVDSIAGQWDYIEPVLFGYAAGKLIETFVSIYCDKKHKVVAHFHEWMTASGGLYLKSIHAPVATAFTTHATILGRSIAGNHLPLYRDLEKFNPDALATQFGITAKYSMEKTAAHEYDAFSTVSDVTARECQYLLNKEPDIVTPNGFEDDFVWKGEEFDRKRAEARKALIRVAEATLGIQLGDSPLIVGTSGRYEYTNKGIDLFIESLKELATRNIDREIVAYVTVPAGNNGPRIDLVNHLKDPASPVDPNMLPNITHYLADYYNDPIIRATTDSPIVWKRSNVHLIFVPSYLDGADGIFNIPYYSLLVGMDLTLYPSYYEPWGYTPLESISYSVPTITTTLAGFGQWMEREKSHKGVYIVARNDDNAPEVATEMANLMAKFAVTPQKTVDAFRNSAKELSETVLWSNLINYYKKLYHTAITNNQSVITYDLTSEKFSREDPTSTAPRWTRLMIEREIPKSLSKLEELSKNLWFSWKAGGDGLFDYIDPELWKKSNHNPVSFLDTLSQTRMEQLEKDTKFLGMLDSLYAEFRAYMDEKPNAKGPHIAYFSMEYGLTNFLKIYSGGLGILAGDYLKEASDKNVPITAVGLLYRYGYFTQKLSAAGDQEAIYEPQDFDSLPITPVRDENGTWKSVQLSFPGRIVIAHVWKCEVGRTTLYLLDTDHELNLPEDRAITHHLYGGDWENRLKQELVLGIGGMRMLNELGVKADVFHCNEGHAAFIGLERLRVLINDGLTFDEAKEIVRASSLFTTHTPVPAGHDAFATGMIRQYLSHYPDRFGITWERFIALGLSNPNDPNEQFSMSYLACNLSQEVNGVSMLHGEVSKVILKDLWKGYFPCELHIGYVTNGVHMPTWTAPSLMALYDKTFGADLMETQFDQVDWNKIHDVDDKVLWDERLKLKDRLIRTVKRRVADPKQFRFDSPRQLVLAQESIRTDVLTIGFARRFATYKRGNLIFRNLDRLDKIVNNPDRPVQFIFAGKAHPNDKPGQDLIKRIIEVSRMPQFVGKIIFLQNYNIQLAKKLVQGVDVWLNTPTRPLEASGTSGEKCAMNGVLHFSVLDGWWVEGYQANAGWALPLENTFENAEHQDEIDAEMIYSTIEKEIAPKYYKRDKNNIPNEWIEAVKYCISDIAKQFNTNRMLNDYIRQYYLPLAERSAKLAANDFAEAKEIAAWKDKMRKAWDGVNVLKIKQFDLNKSNIKAGDRYMTEVQVYVNGLDPHDIGIELVVANPIKDDKVTIDRKLQLHFIEQKENIATYGLDQVIHDNGTYDIAVRLYPKNPKLPNRMDFPLYKWI